MASRNPLPGTETSLRFGAATRPSLSALNPSASASRSASGSSSLWTSVSLSIKMCICPSRNRQALPETSSLVLLSTPLDSHQYTPGNDHSTSSPQLFQHKFGQLSNMRLGRYIHAAVLKRLRRHTELRHLAHLPVLLVDDIEDLDSIHRIETRPAHYLGIEEPVAGHASPVGSLWVQRVDNHVIIQQVQQRIRHQHDTIVSASIFRKQAAQWRAAGLPRNRKSLGSLCERRRIPVCIRLA